MQSERGEGSLRRPSPSRTLSPSPRIGERSGVGQGTNNKINRDSEKSGRVMSSECNYYLELFPTSSLGNDFSSVPSLQKSPDDQRDDEKWQDKDDSERQDKEH